jgi:hypothetical protein
MDASDQIGIGLGDATVDEDQGPGGATCRWCPHGIQEDRVFGGEYIVGDVKVKGDVNLEAESVLHAIHERKTCLS